MPLPREEYIEQAHFFRSLAERMQQNLATQELLGPLREEALSTTKLPLALEFLHSELRHLGVMAPAMARLGHYFTAFQTFVIAESENERGRFDFRQGLKILEREAEYRAQGASPQGIFLYQFEAIARNRLGYDRGLAAVAEDPIFDPDWRDWILTVRRQIGIVDLADMVYVRSEHYLERQSRSSRKKTEPEAPVLWGVKEGKIALANRSKDPLLLFSALERHLGYPQVPRPRVADASRNLLPSLVRRVEQLESRLKLVEEEQRGGIDITRFYDRRGRDGAPEPPHPG